MVLPSKQFGGSKPPPYQFWGDTLILSYIRTIFLYLVLIAVVLTGLGVFDRIARFAGAGTLVPITGFANAVGSTAIDAQSEGWILGVGAKIFSVAGPVLLYGTLAGAVYGVVYWVVSLF